MSHMVSRIVKSKLSRASRRDPLLKNRAPVTYSTVRGRPRPQQKHGGSQHPQRSAGEPAQQPAAGNSAKRGRNRQNAGRELSMLPCLVATDRSRSRLGQPRLAAQPPRQPPLRNAEKRSGPQRNATLFPQQSAAVRSSYCDRSGLL